MKLDKDGKTDLVGEFSAERGFIMFCSYGLCTKEATMQISRTRNHNEFTTHTRNLYCPEHAPDGSKEIK